MKKITSKKCESPLDSYSKNDVSVAADIQTQPGDLLLRDRGYFLIDLIGQMKSTQVDTISRYKHGTTLYDSTNGQPIDLFDLLTREGSVDRIVLAGSRKHVRVRLLAAPVTEEIANLRRMKAKKETKGHAPSDELLRLLSWSIFLVTIEDPALTLASVLQIYGLRWRIENIFKTWKSNFSFAKLHNVSRNQLTILLLARFIVITLCHRAFVRLQPEILSACHRHLSLIKFMRFLSLRIAILPALFTPGACTTALFNGIVRCCTYECRKRRNFADLTGDAVLALQNLCPLT